jgi:phosphoribosylglycinamide formyltransferase 1
VLVEIHPQCRHNETDAWGPIWASLFGAGAVVDVRWIPRIRCVGADPTGVRVHGVGARNGGSARQARSQAAGSVPAMRLAVLASGSGTILDAILTAGIPVEVVVVDRPCGATAVADEHGIAWELVERTTFGDDFDRDGYTGQVVDVLAKYDIDLVVMAGFGTIFGRAIFEAFDGHIVNTHPALLPSFKGWHAVRAALDAGVKVTGCTVHIATAQVDDGPILAQEAVPVLPDDDEASLHERIKVVERRLYIRTIKDILERGSVQ